MDTTKKKKKTKTKPVIVIWHDAHADQSGSWMEMDDFHHNPYIVESCGFLLDGVKSGHVSLAQSWSHEDMVDSVIHIPQAMVVQITRLHKDKD